MAVTVGKHSSAAFKVLCIDTRLDDLGYTGIDYTWEHVVTGGRVVRECLGYTGRVVRECLDLAVASSGWQNMLHITWFTTFISIGRIIMPLKFALVSGGSLGFPLTV